jgi:hypothetical protein
MVHLRTPYVPAFLAAPRRPQLARVGAAGSEYEAVPEYATQPRPSPFTLSIVGAEDAKRPMTTGERALAGVYLAPFVLGPPAVGYLLLGTVGAVVGAIWAAPAIYLVAGGLLSFDGDATVEKKP